MDSPFLDADKIRAATFIRHVEIHDTLGSTNDRAAELAREANIALPALVVARHQTAGRGRGKNTWWSADGALTFSVLLEPAEMGIPTANWPQLSLATAVAVCDALRKELDATVNPKSILGIKWPNDVLLDGRKVGGILIESPGGAALGKNCLMVGIGINVNNSPPEVLNCNALCDATGNQHDLFDVLTRLLSALKQRLSQLGCGRGELPRRWQELCLLKGKTVRIDSGNQVAEGRFAGLADDGAALVDTANGQLTIYSGTLREAS